MTAPPSLVQWPGGLSRSRPSLSGQLRSEARRPGEPRVPRDSRRVSWWLVALIACGLLLELAVLPAARAQVQVSGLQCRLGDGPWQPCRMEVQDVGLRWLLRIGDLRVEFRHAGDGAVRMQKGSGPWQPVTASWKPDTSLCWDGVCAKGAIPLD